MMHGYRLFSYIQTGVNVDNGDSIEYWSEQAFSTASDTGGAVRTFDPESGGTTSLEFNNKPDVGVAVSVYDPEIQALLAFE